MSKLKINNEEISRDINNVFKIINEFENNKGNIKDLEKKAKKLKEKLEKKYSNYLDSKK
tara:strand:- start:28 stop:204 length:177 start_codon:yes stop_codon:yes gene_type:complete